MEDRFCIASCFPFRYQIPQPGHTEAPATQINVDYHPQNVHLLLDIQPSLLGQRKTVLHVILFVTFLLGPIKTSPESPQNVFC
jgi:hypothetical protein